MSDFITLSCPSCGGKLQINNEDERLVCPYCGNEHVVSRAAGGVLLAPVMAGLQKVQDSSDRVAAELAIQRLTPEFKAVEAQQEEAEHTAQVAARRDELHSRTVTWLFAGVAVVSVLLYVVMVATFQPARSTRTSPVCVPAGLAIMCGGLALLRYREHKTLRRNAVVAQENLAKVHQVYVGLKQELDRQYETVRRH